MNSAVHVTSHAKKFKKDSLTASVKKRHHQTPNNLLKVATHDVEQKKRI